MISNIKVELTDAEVLTLVMCLALAMEKLDTRENYDEICKLYKRFYDIYLSRFPNSPPVKPNE